MLHLGKDWGGCFIQEHGHTEAIAGLETGCAAKRDHPVGDLLQHLDRIVLGQSGKQLFGLIHIGHRMIRRISQFV